MNRFLLVVKCQPCKCKEIPQEAFIIRTEPKLKKPKKFTSKFSIRKLVYMNSKKVLVKWIETYFLKKENFT